MARHRGTPRLAGIDSERLRALYDSGMTDCEIGTLLGVSGEAVGMKRRIFGIPTRRQVQALESVSSAVLADMYSRMSEADLADVFNVSKPTVRKYLRKHCIPVISKHYRYTSKIAFSDIQKETIQGLLLGDAHLLERGSLKVSHYFGQLPYLQHLQALLAQFSSPIRYAEKVMDNGTLTYSFLFQTMQHEDLLGYRQLFYPAGVRVFPASILENLTARSLAYWYFDDGHFDDGLPSFALGDISDDAWQEVLRLVATRFSLETYARSSMASCKIMGIRAKSRDALFQLIREFATPDMLYKMPKEHWPVGVVPFNVGKMTDANILPSSLIDRCAVWSVLSEGDRNILVSDLKFFWDDCGFPYANARSEEKNILSNLTVDHVLRKDTLRNLHVGRAVCDAFSRNIFPLEVESRLIRELLESGKVPNSFWIRNSFGEAHFSPAAAKALVLRYCPEGGVVHDLTGDKGILLGTVMAGARYLGNVHPEMIAWMRAEDHIIRGYSDADLVFERDRILVRDASVLEVSYGHRVLRVCPL